MTTQTEALKLALEALDFSTSPSPCVEELQDDAIVAIKEALAQPEQEPVAWMLNGFPYKEKQVQVGGPCRGQEFPNQTPLYTTPPQRKPWMSLGDEDVAKLCDRYPYSDETDELVRAADAKLRELNGFSVSKTVESDTQTDFSSTDEQRKPLTDWIDPNDKTQERFLPNIGEPVLFCHEGKTYYGKHNGGSFQHRGVFQQQYFRTWECHWMPLPAAHGIKGDA